MAEQKCNWVIHYMTNGIPCECCGKVEYHFPPQMCDALTDGMWKYGHMEFQLVLNYQRKEIMRLLNTMGMRVAKGERFKDGDLIEGLYLDCSVKLQEFPDIDGKPVLRLIIPDKENRWPEEAGVPYCGQLFSTFLLHHYGDLGNALDEYKKNP